MLQYTTTPVLRSLKEGTLKERRLRVMVAKPGLDGHDRGARIIARAFRDAGFEVVYTGLHQTPEEIVKAAIQEDVDMIGLSSLAGAHMYLYPRVVELLREQGAGEIVVCGGGIIPEEDIPKLKTVGVKEIFGPGSALKEMVEWVRNNVKPRGY
jgi:methylmalonyl-CoA mutase C-terminal domain/subunit